MKKIRNILSVLIIVILLPVMPVQAHDDAKEHYRELEMMLFNSENFSRTADEKVKEKIDIIERASTLCIDQMGDKNSKDLDKLEEYGVRELPENVSEINPDKTKTQLSAKNHRTYTHQGWDINYEKVKEGDLANWKARKNILLSSVDEVMDFGGISGKWLFFDFGYSKKCNSFSALIYYSHILGDYIEDTNDKDGNFGKFNGTSNGTKIPFACNAPNSVDMFSELEKHIENLFGDQEDTNVYKYLMKDIQTLARKARKISDDKGKIEAEDYDEMKGCVQELMDILTGRNGKYNAIHELLMNESYFTDAFYPDGV